MKRNWQRRASPKQGWEGKRRPTNLENSGVGKEEGECIDP